jgi:hypothetical protein
MLISLVILPWMPYCSKQPEGTALAGVLRQDIATIVLGLGWGGVQSCCRLAKDFQPQPRLP